VESSFWSAEELLMSIALSPHIVLDDHGVAWLDGTTVKVKEVVVDVLAHGSSPEEIHFQYPHLSLGQIHAALSYYHDHKPAFDAEIACDIEEVRRCRSQDGETPGRRRLRAEGR
jgi:uncharacterized protein (DUF433 family)